MIESKSTQTSQGGIAGWLSESPSKNIAIVGGCVAGLSAAMVLARAGHRVHVLDSDILGDTTSALEAFECWDRRGSPQARHAHAFLGRLHKLIKEHSPDFLERLLAAGAEELPFDQMIPPTIENPEFIPSDSELTMLSCRRITFEWVLRRYLRELGVEIEEGAVVTGLLSDDLEGGIPVVRGIRYRDRNGTNRERAADLVLDASGRKSHHPEWLEEIGCAPMRHESEPCGIVYSSRFYRLEPGATRPFSSGFAGGDLGYLRYGVFPSDSNLFSLIVASSPDDRRMRALQRPEGFELALGALPSTRDWLAPGVSRPAADIHTMAGLRNVRRFFVEDGLPRALGFQPVGDALCHSNPLLGRGCTYAFIEAHLISDALEEHPRDPVAFAQAFDRGVETEVIPGYEFTRQSDRAFIQKERALRAGGEAEDPPATTPEEKRREFMSSLMRDGFRPAMATDLHVLRAFMRAMNLLDPMDQMVKNENVMARAMTFWKDRGNRKVVIDGPTREELIDILEASAAA